MGTIRGLVTEWNPENVRSEAEAEQSLYEFLCSKLAGFRIRRQYPHDRIRADIVIEDIVAIELKWNLQSTEEFQRFIGQLEGYSRWGVGLVVVFLGSCDPDLVARVKDRVGSDWDDSDAEVLIK